MRHRPVAKTALPRFFSQSTKFVIAAYTLTLLFAFMYITTVRAGEEQSTGAPRLVVPENAYDFGTAVEGEKVIHDFVLKNPGTSILDIQKVKTG
jgi:hypothetical protein